MEREEFEADLIASFESFYKKNEVYNTEINKINQSIQTFSKNQDIFRLKKHDVPQKFNYYIDTIETCDLLFDTEEKYKESLQKLQYTERFIIKKYDENIKFLNSSIKLYNQIKKDLNFQIQNLDKLILEEKTKFDIEDTVDIYDAARRGKLCALRSWIIKDPIKINVPDKQGKTALYYCVESNNIETTKYLLKQKVNSTIGDIKSKISPLHLACYNGNFTIVTLFTKLNMFSCLLDKQKQTVLHAAVQSKNINIIKYLLNYESAFLMLYIKNKDGLIPVELAHNNSLHDIYALLMKKMHSSEEFNRESNLFQYGYLNEKDKLVDYDEKGDEYNRIPENIPKELQPIMTDIGKEDQI